jgi:hypothetical protein
MSCSKFPSKEAISAFYKVYKVQKKLYEEKTKKCISYIDRDQWEYSKCLLKLTLLSINSMAIEDYRRINSKKRWIQYFKRVEDIATEIMEERRYCPRLLKLYKIITQELKIKTYSSDFANNIKYQSENDQ